ncbi:MAG: uroporphyrinogen decarboxylase family protein [Phycisphaerae bacterium]|nr:uroporphyrinogen decarboxylase family protein [Phycisphaerae bacterium]
MTPRERILATLKHQCPDRVPIELGWRDEVMDAAKKHYRVDTEQQVAQILGADNTRGANIKTRWPDYEKRINGELNGPFGTIGKTVLHDERTFEDRWGVVERVGSTGKYLQWITGPFEKTDDLDSFNWPDERNIVDDPALPTKVAAHKAAGYWVEGSSGAHPFKQAWRMRGFENFLCDYIANPSFVEAIYERILRYNIPVVTRAAAAGADQFCYWGDVAMQDRMIVPPDRWRALDGQAWRQIIRAARKVNPHVTFFFHSDGDIRPIMDDLIDIGFDIINPIQPECMNPAAVKRQWGSRVTLDGGGSVQRTLPFGTLADVKREVEFLLTTCAYDGGYIFRASNTVGYDCPIANVIAYYELARDFDLSKLPGPPGKIPNEPPCMSIKVAEQVGRQQVID